MSYILEALKKSERQRTIGQVPGIDSVHERTANSVAGNWVRVVVAVLVLNAGLLLLLLWPETETETGNPVEPVKDPVSPLQGALPPPPAPESRGQRATPLTPIPELPPAEPPRAEPEAVPAVRKTVVAAVEPPSPRPKVAPPPKQVERPAVPPPLPVWPQIPSHLYQQLSGKLRLDVHVYSEQVQDRFVLINLRKYQEGEKLQEGPQLDAITAEGVILSFRGQSFRVKAK